MKALPIKMVDGHGTPCEPSEATHLAFHMPGPSGRLSLPVIIKGARAGTGCWTWNGDTEKPTLKPSLLTRCGRDGKIVCHSWVNDGQAHFLPDSTHELAGRVVDLLDVEENP